MLFLLNFPHKYSNFRDFNYFKSYSTLKIARDNHPKKTWSHLSYDIPILILLLINLVMMNLSLNFYPL